MTNRRAGYSLVRFVLNSPDALRLAEFYEKTCRSVVMRCERKTDPAGALRLELQLGDSILEIRQDSEPGRPYPHELPPYDLRFQHFAIVVADMPQAMQCLDRVSGWAPISTHGPQTLPPSAGGVTAFKFRDPDGHPLEFLLFPPQRSPAHWARTDTGVLFSGIDHSAISIRNVDDSVRFYESLGLVLSTRNLNEGFEQARLDGIRHPQVDVIGLTPHTPTPHLELLHYRAQVAPRPPTLACNDIAASRLVLSATPNSGDTMGRIIQDPDGHFLEFLD